MPCAILEGGRISQRSLHGKATVAVAEFSSRTATRSGLGKLERLQSPQKTDKQPWMRIGRQIDAEMGEQRGKPHAGTLLLRRGNRGATGANGTTKDSCERDADAAGAPQERL